MYVCTDYAYGLRDSLKKIGYNAHVMGDYNFTMYAELLQIAGDQSRMLQIIVGSHDIQMHSQNYIAVHTEQPWMYHNSSFKNVYGTVLRQALLVWTYCERHRHDFSELFHISTGGVRTVPMYIYSRSHFYENEVEKNYDMTFFGSCSEHRVAVLKEMLSLSEQYGLKLIYTCVRELTDIVAGEELDMTVLRSKIVINIHSRESSSLEVHRVMHLLSLGIPVVSERSASDPQTDLEFEESGAVFFGNSTVELFQKAVELCTNGSRLQQASIAAKKKYDSIMNNLEPLKAAMTAAEEAIAKRDSPCE